MCYSSAGPGLKIWKKDLTFRSTPGLATSGLGFVFTGGLVHRYFVVVGCSAGHPVEVIRVLIEEVTQLSSLVTECKLQIISIIIIIVTFFPLKC